MQNDRNYTKTIDLSFSINEDTYKEVQDQIAALGEDVNLSDDTVLKTISDILKRGRGLEIGERQEVEDLTSDTFEKMFETIGKEFGSKLNNVGTKFVKDLKQVFIDAWKELDQILSYSRLSNKEVREQAFEFGFSPAQNYAWDKATSLLGVESLEDIAFMTKNQREKFMEKFNEYSERYGKLYDSGFFDQLEEYEWEMAEFKEDLQYSVMQFFVDNKEAIKSALKAIMKLAEITANIFGWLLDIKTGPATSQERLSNIQQMIHNGNNENVTNNNVKIDNTFNGVAQSDKTWLQNAGAMTYEQVIRAMGGRG